MNRATRARQLLLRRTRLPIPDAVERLVGLQAQTPHSWYIGLWARLEGFRPEVVSDLIRRRKLVRTALMRATIHLGDRARLRLGKIDDRAKPRAPTSSRSSPGANTLTSNSRSPKR